MSSSTKPSYVLRYFPAPGIAEPIRVLLTAAQVEWTEEHPEWPDKKNEQPYGRLPVLLEKGADGEVETTFAEGTAIIRYLARKYGFMPTDLKQATSQEQLADFINDTATAFHLRRYTSEENKEMIITKFDGMLDKVLEVSTEALRKNGSNGHFHGDKLSYADILTYCFIKHLYVQAVQFQESLPSIVTSKLALEHTKLIKAVEAEPLLQKYMESTKSLNDMVSQ
ncbi:hypothetical protein H4R99_005041 [Coemansia sp. RSA 1722]|nr:hypothetical protein LPJ57_003161 [Coemansia sp. RSA 486]KAJ2229825.1 hypothetical protein IWW45_006044 [Coemansia sp. RSA 485]KAJ2596155.1 hypothetical protein H4R99_005041 [Coemansia sp. RSA 1722]